MIVGMDFGTTNSGMAIYDGRDLRRFSLDPAATNPRIARTALYITNEQDIYIGREAIDRYFAHNVGRPVKLQKVWVGEIEVIADLVYFVQDAYVWADVMSPGRLFLSFKTLLRDQNYTGTVIGQSFFPLESLVGLYLFVTRLRAEQLLGREVTDVVLGRPVHFADDQEHDNLAQERLLRSAFQAGYRRVYLEREPIAAAYHYASTSVKAENILVFDFGGGTLDITIMRLGNGARQVLATGGVPVAGDVFDQKLVRAKLPRHFGEGGRYGDKEMPIPKWIYDTFSNWQTILELQTPDNRRILEQIARTAERPRDIRALISLVSGNYGLQMFDVVEQAKRDLSARFGTMIRLDGPGFDVLELVTRREFETIIRPEFLRIEQHLDATVRASGLRPEQIDAVLRTGGSAEVPLFQQMLRRKFGADRVHSIDTFGSVTAGLGIIAHGIEQGEIAARPFTPADLKRAEVTVSRPNVSIVDLSLLKRRVETQERTADETARSETILVLLTAANELQVLNVATGWDATTPALDSQHVPPLLAALTANSDEQLLCITSRYRFLLVDGRQLLDMAAIGQTMQELYHFGPREKIFVVARWSHLKQQEKLLLATSLGFVRAFPMDVLVKAIEAPVPLTFERPLPGWPIAAIGANQGDQVIVVTARGRAVRYPLDEIPAIGMQALNRADDDSIVATVVATRDTELLLLTDRGYGRRLPANAVFRPEKANSHGRVVLARAPLRVAISVPSQKRLAVLVSKGLVPVEVTKIPLEPDSTRSHRLLRLDDDEEVRGVLLVDGEGVPVREAQRG